MSIDAVPHQFNESPFAALHVDINKGLADIGGFGGRKSGRCGHLALASPLRRPRCSGFAVHSSRPVA